MTKEIVSDKAKTLDFDTFKSEVLADYKLACISRETSLLGRKEVLTGKAKFGIFGDVFHTFPSCTGAAFVPHLEGEHAAAGGGARCVMACCGDDDVVAHHVAVVQRLPVDGRVGDRAGRAGLQHRPRTHAAAQLVVRAGRRHASLLGAAGSAAVVACVRPAPRAALA